MTDLFAGAVKSIYLPLKVMRSKKFLRMPRNPLPKVSEAENGKITLALANAVNAQCGKLTYQPDPANGLYDMYNHPEHTQYLLDTGNYGKSSNDCDDYAAYAQALFREAGVDPSEHWEWNVLVKLLKQPTQGKYNHVICGFRMGDWYGVIDTNTAARGKIFWFKGSLNDAKKHFIETFKETYPADYYELVEGNWLKYCYTERV